jgi:hypothetical protein
MNLTMMRAAERDGELVADLRPHREWLREAQVMRIAGPTAANKTSLAGNKFAVLRIA